MAYSLKVIARFVDVAPDTVRKWETRHGIVSPARRANGYREYSQEDLRRLRLFLKLKEEGKTASDAALEVKRAKFPQRDSSGEMTERISKAALRFDRDEIGKLYERSIRSGLFNAYRDVWLPALIYFGVEAQRRKGVWIAAEHFTTGFLRERLLQDFSNARTRRGSDLVMAAPEGDFHELGLLMAFCSLEQAGLRCLYLGANLPTDALGGAVLCSGARAAALTLTKPISRKDLKKLIGEFRRAAPGAALYVAGQASLKHANVIAENGAVFIGTDLENGVRRIALGSLSGAKR